MSYGNRQIALNSVAGVAQVGGALRNYAPLRYTGLGASGIALADAWAQGEAGGHDVAIFLLLNTPTTSAVFMDLQQSAIKSIQATQVVGGVAKSVEGIARGVGVNQADSVKLPSVVTVSTGGVAVVSGRIESQRISDATKREQERRDEEQRLNQYER